MKTLADGRGRTIVRRVAPWIAVCALLSCFAGPLANVLDEAGAGAVGPDRAAARGGSIAAHPVPGIEIFEGHTIGPPLVIDNLAAFPVYATEQEDIGEFVTLDAALERGTAVVRELGAERSAEGSMGNRNGDPPEQAQNSQNVPQNGPQNGRPHRGGDSARVNTLVIENKGAVAILVLAGTIVKGGKQDRQIGQDFVIGAKETQSVDAFCIEHGRWNGDREGASTGGKFKTMKILAVGDVRAAGQYEGSQGEVWKKVGETNRKHGKESASDTLVASVEDKEVLERRGALARNVLAFFAEVPQPGDVVGMAYAVDGKVRGVRSFLNHRLFKEYAEVLANTAALEALTAQAAAKTAGKPVADGKAAPEAVVAFVRAVADGKKQERDTTAKNKNAYTFDDDGYSAETYLKAAPPAAGATASPKSAAPKKPVTRDYLSK